MGQNSTDASGLKHEIEDAQPLLGNLQKQPMTEETIAAIKVAEDSLQKLLEREEIMWFQRSRVSWLKYGDKNTWFFPYEGL